MADEITEIRNALKNDTIIIGKETVLKMLRHDKISKILLSSNVSEENEADIEHHASVAGVPVVKISVPSEELKVLCKKQYLISVLGIKK